MFRIRKDQMEALVKARAPDIRHAWVEGLRDAGLKAEEDPKSGEILLSDKTGGTTRLTPRRNGISLKSVEGRTYHVEHGPGGQLTGFTDPLGQKIEIDYDKDGSVREVRRNGRCLLHCDYSQEGNIVEGTFADGAREQLEYASGELLRTVDASGAEIRFVRDASLRLVEVVDPRGHSTRFDYDEDGTPLRTLFPDGTEESYEKDAEGNLAIKINGQNHVRITSDESGAIERAEFSDGHFITLHWDEDKILEASNPHTTVSFEYDSEGRVVKEKQGNLQIEYEYDGEGNLVAIKTSDGEELRFHYSADNLLTRLIDWNGLELTFGHDQVGSTTRIQFPNGVTTVATTSPEGHYTSIRTTSAASPSAPIIDESYEYDARDRLVRREVPGSFWKYTYDPGGRLIKCEDTAKGISEVFHYDSSGNRAQNGSKRAEYDKRNRILTSGGERFKHGAQGNMTERSGSRSESYRYNGQGHLIEVQTDSGARIEFTYDALGRRIRKRCGETTTHYLWMGRQLLREWTERRGDVIERRDYVFFPGEPYPLTVRINGRVHYYHTDRLGTPLALTDQNGRVAWKAEYSAFGEARVLVTEMRQPLRFQGQYCDDETGLYYNVFRYYDPTLGRYITPDPLRYASGSTNFYPYAHNDPVNRVDPYGLIVPLVAIGIIAGAALIGGLIGGAIAAATGGSFWQGVGWGAAAGAVGAAVPIIGAAAGLGAAAIGGLALAADAVMGGIEACATEGAGIGTFFKGAGIAAGTTLATLGLSKIPGVRRALGAVGKRLSSTTQKLGQRAGGFFKKAIPQARPRRVWNKEAARVARFLKSEGVPAKFRRQVIKAFGPGTRVETLPDNMIAYRYYGGKADPRSHWLTERLVRNPVQELALPPGSTAENVKPWIIRKGTRVLRGPVARQRQWRRTGGGSQIYVPNKSVLRDVAR